MSIVTLITYLCVEEQVDRMPRLVHKAAPYVDTAIGIALVLIAILGTQGIIPMSSNVSYSLLGLGAAYVSTSILNQLLECKMNNKSCSREYLFKAPRIKYEANGYQPYKI